MANARGTRSATTQHWFAGQRVAPGGVAFEAMIDGELRAVPRGHVFVEGERKALNLAAVLGRFLNRLRGPVFVRDRGREHKEFRRLPVVPRLFQGQLHEFD